MPNAFLKPTVIVKTALGLLVRDITLPRLVWRDAVPDFAGAFGDTVSIRVPAFAPARTRALRAGTARTRDAVTERKVDVSLTTDVYKDIRITDEELSLDISDFGTQVLNPAVQGVVEALENVLIAKMQEPSYHTTINFNTATDDAWDDLVIPAREALNKAHVPMNERALAVGSELESALLRTDMFVKANESGSTNALEDATIGRKAGFQIVSAPGLGPLEGYAFHKTAYVMNERAPKVPPSAPYGASESYNGFALRVVKVLDPDTIEEILALDAWVGANYVTDDGYFDSNGIFIPSDGALGSAVTLANPSSAGDDIVDTAANHGFQAGDAIVFTALTGGAGLVVGRRYYVIAANLAATTFQVALTPGGAAIDFTTNITAGSVKLNGAAQMVRAVKIAGS